MTGFEEMERMILVANVQSLSGRLSPLLSDSLALDKALGELAIAVQDVREHIDAEWRGLRAAQSGTRSVSLPPTLDELA